MVEERLAREGSRGKSFVPWEGMRRDVVTVIASGTRRKRKTRRSEEMKMRRKEESQSTRLVELRESS